MQVTEIQLNSSNKGCSYYTYTNYNSASTSLLIKMKTFPIHELITLNTLIFMYLISFWQTSMLL